MARAGLVSLTDSTFEVDGRRIDYKKVNRTILGRSAEAGATVVYFPQSREMVDEPRPAGRKKAKTKRKSESRVAAAPKPKACKPVAPESGRVRDSCARGA